MVSGIVPIATAIAHRIAIASVPPIVPVASDLMANGRRGMTTSRGGVFFGGWQCLPPRLNLPKPNVGWS